MSDHLELSAEQARDWLALQEVLEPHRPLPCESDAGSWTADDSRAQRYAAHACLDCPVMWPCRAYGLKYPDERGAYGGLTYRERQPRKQPKEDR